MLENILEVENQRILNAGGKTVSSFGKAMRTTLRSNFEDGDILEFPVMQFANGKLTDAKGKNLIISSPLIVNGKRVVRDGKEQTIEFIHVLVHRGDATQTARFFPSSLWKVRREVIGSQAPFSLSEERKTASGNVVEACQAFATADEAVHSLSGKKVLVHLDTFPALPYGTTVEDLTEIPANDSVAEFTFVEDAPKGKK